MQTHNRCRKSLGALYLFRVEQAVAVPSGFTVLYFPAGELTRLYAKTGGIGVDVLHRQR